jgi:hypothetical protein
MATIPLVALHAQNEQPSPLAQYAQLQAIQGAQQEQQLRQQQQQMLQTQTQGAQQENQLRALQLRDQQIISDSYKKNNGDLDKTFNDAAQNGATPGSLIQLHTAILGQKQKEQELLKTGTENLQNQNDALIAAHDYVKSLPEEQRPTAYQAQLQNLAKVPGIDVSKLPQQYDPNTFDTIGAGLAGTSTRLQALARMKAAGKPPEGEMPLGADRVGQLNQALQTRYQVLNPGQPLPQQFALPPDANQKDYDRVDKIMQATEQAQAAKGSADDRKTQQSLINSIREQTLEIAKQGLELRQRTADQKDSDFIDKNYVKPANDAEKSYQMFMDAYKNKDDAKTGAESMLALSTHLATTFGNVKGSRVTKDMIQEHLGARSVSDSALVAVQKLSNGDVLSPDQWDAFKTLISNSRNLSWQTAKKEADRRGVDISGSLPADLGGKPSTSQTSPQGYQPLPSFKDWKAQQKQP